MKVYKYIYMLAFVQLIYTHTRIYIRVYNKERNTWQRLNWQQFLGANFSTYKAGKDYDSTELVQFYCARQKTEGTSRDARKSHRYSPCLWAQGTYELVPCGDYMKRAGSSCRGQSEVCRKECMCAPKHITHVTKVPTETRSQPLLNN